MAEAQFLITIVFNNSVSELYTLRTAHELAQLSYIAQVFQTRADELSPTTQAEENMCSSLSSYRSLWAN